MLNYMNPKQIFENFRNDAADLTGEQLSLFFDSLPEVNVDELIGDWKGGYFNFQQNEVSAQLETLRWFGKSIISSNHVDPLICLDEENNPFVFKDMGEGILRMVYFRNGVTAALIYDNFPIIDHFRKIDHDTMLGMMEAKVLLKEDEYFYFFLERI